MSIKINFDAAGNPEEPTIVLAKRNGDRIGKINAKDIELTDNLNDAAEMSFTVYKYVDGVKDQLWDKITNFKLVYCVEWNQFFEITVEVNESADIKKTISCTALGPAELGQIMLYGVEINTETDISRDEYKIPTVLYRENNHEASLLHRIMEKAPHYTIGHVDATIANIQRTFTFDDKSIYDALQDIAEEINCLFVFSASLDENNKLVRKISAYDLESNCKKCGNRDEFVDKCPKCENTDITEGYGKDTTIFVTADELGDNIQLSTDTDEIKNCFKLEAGDDLMNATIKSCNPNGSDYIWYLSDAMKEDMSKELVKAIDGEVIDGKVIGGYNQKYNSYQTDDITIEDKENKPIEKYNNIVAKYNKIVEKYNGAKYGKNNFASISVTSKGCPNFKGFTSLINTYYDVVDLSLYLKSSLMPTVDTSTPTVDDMIKRLTVENISPVAVNKSSNSKINALKSLSKTSADGLVLSMAKTLVDGRFKVEVASSSLDDYKDGDLTRTWTGTFTVTNYSDKDNSKTMNESIKVVINDEYETFIKRKIDQALANTDEENVSTSGLFKLGIDGFKNKSETDKTDNWINNFKEQLAYYSLNRLKSFLDACDSCLDIMYENGVANKETWGTGSNKDANLYENLYVPYMKMEKAIVAEIAVRDSEIATVCGEKDDKGNLKTTGVQNIIEDKRSEIQEELDFKKYLDSVGSDLWLEFCSFRRDDKYSNDNYISDGLNNAELIAKAKEFIEVAQKEIYKSAELQRSVSSDLKNLLVMKKFRPLVQYFEVGNWIRILVDDEVYKLRLTSYTIDYDDIDSISVDFADEVRAASNVRSVQDVLSQASSMATSYSSTQRQAKQGEKSNNVIGSWFENGLDTTNTKIVGGADGQSQTWDNHGILLREYNVGQNEYSPEQMKIINSTIAITDDNWETTKTAIGKYYYYKDGERKMTYGVNAETVVGKLLIGEQIELNNSGNSMMFNENGLTMENNVNKISIDPDNDTPLFSIKKKTKEQDGNYKYANIFNLDSSGNVVITGSIVATNITLSEGAKVNKTDSIGLSDVALDGKYTNLIGDETKSGQVLRLSTDGKVDSFMLSEVATTSSYSDLSSKLNLKTVATSGKYSDLTDTPALKAVATSGSYNDLSDKPALKTIATSGKYTDLIVNKSDAEKLLYVDKDGNVTTISIAVLKQKLT